MRDSGFRRNDVERSRNDVERGGNDEKHRPGMKRIRLKLYASLSDYLPPLARDCATQLEVADDATPAQIIRDFQVPERLAHLVLLNGVYLQPADRGRPLLQEGDTLAVWPPVAGG